MIEICGGSLLNLEGAKAAGHRENQPNSFLSSTAFPDDQSVKAQIALPSKDTELEQKEKNPINMNQSMT